MIVVLEKFKERGFIENIELLSRLWNGSFTIEVFPCTLERIKKYNGRKVVIMEALEKGIKIDLERYIKRRSLD